MEQLLIDFTRFAHLASLALGLSLTLRLDLALARRLPHTFDEALLGHVERTHRLVSVALVALWISGLALLYLRTGFDLSAFTPKLWAKLGVVAVLTVNAVAIGAIALPLLRRNIGRGFADAALSDRVSMASSAALSGASWLSALALGAFAALKPLAAEPFIAGAMLIYGGAVLCGALLAVMAPALLRPNAAPIPRAAAVA